MPPHMPQYVDFDVLIEADGQGGYRVHVQSSAGQTHAEFQLPFSDAQLENRLLKLKMVLMRSGGPSNRAILSPEEQAVQDFGQGLFEALMTANVRSLYDASRNQAAHADKGVRLRLQMSAPELASLPWEFLYDARQRVYLCRQKDTPLVRYLEVSAPVPTLTVNAPLRILAMIASPTDLHPLDTEREKRRMEQSLARLTQAGQIELVWVNGGHWRDLQQALWHGPWHVFHYIGHGGFDTRIDEGVLAFEGADGRMQPMRARDLADLLTSERHLRFAFLNACLGAAGGERDVFASTAATLVQRGTPAVLAMQYEITDKAAIEFGQTFYEALADGLPVDTATTMARQAIHFGVPNSLEWGTPVLYSRATSGALFVVNASAMPVIQSEPIKPPVIPVVAHEAKSDYAAQYRAARTLYAEENYAAALDQFRVLQAAGFKPPVGRLETLIAEIESSLDEQQRAQEAAERVAQYEAIYAELQHEVSGARSPARKTELREALAEFMAAYPEYGDPAGLVDKLRPPEPQQASSVPAAIANRTPDYAVLLQQAIDLSNAQRFDEALPILDGLSKIGYNLRVVTPMLTQNHQDLESKATDEAERQQAEVNRQQIEAERIARHSQCQQDYEMIALLARNNRTLDQARTAWTQFRQTYPDWDKLLGSDSADLDTKLKPPLSPDQQHLLAIMLDPKHPPTERAKAGQDINQYGDPRPGVIDLNFGAEYWCRVPAGGYPLGSDKDSDNKRHTAKLDGFDIGKYPITYAQFQSFIDAEDGFRDPKWWNGLHADALAQKQQSADKQKWPMANHPRENVSWYDAMAFCQWLSAKLGYEAWLPTDDEWEAAARGSDSREYPYPGEFDANKGNTRETGIGQTSAVGIFPSRVSLYGALDVSDNIFEWTLTDYSNEISNIQPRSVRGGSWDGSRGLARAASRRLRYAGGRGDALGFRVLRSVPVT